MRVAAIMPCRGRAEQTVANVRRLLTTAGDVDWQLICMVDRDPAVMGALANADLPVWRMDTEKKGYWYALQQATDYWRVDFTHIASLANDLIPVGPWLRRAVDAYQSEFGDGDGLIGFNGDGHGVEHSCHFLVSQGLLSRYGGWPRWYHHSYGDNELVARATDDRLYAKAPWSILAHDHPYFGGQDDQVYAEGRAQSERDRQLYEQRRAAGWPTVR